MNLKSLKNKFIIPDLSECVDARIRVRRKLFKMLKRGASDSEIANYAIGNVDASANYTAQERRSDGGRLAYSIKSCNRNWEQKVAALTRELWVSKEDTLEVLKRHPISHLGVSVATEIAMILHPRRCCVINRRSLFGRYFIEYKRSGKDDALVQARKNSQEMFDTFDSKNIENLINNFN